MGCTYLYVSSMSMINRVTAESTVSISAKGISQTSIVFTTAPATLSSYITRAIQWGRAEVTYIYFPIRFVGNHVYPIHCLEQHYNSSNVNFSMLP